MGITWVPREISTGALGNTYVGPQWEINGPYREQPALGETAGP